MKGIVNGEAWFIDPVGEVEWRMRYLSSGVTFDDAHLAADVMGCYQRLVDPDITDDEAASRLTAARAVAREILSNLDEEMAGSLVPEWVVMVGSSLHGPYTHLKAQQVAQSRNGVIRRMEP